MEKMDLRSASTQEKEAIRKRAIRMYKQGWRNYEITEALGVNKNSVVNWISTYNAQGIKGLKEKARGRKTGERRLLTIEQEKQVQKWIHDKMPDQLKLPFGLWTRKAVVQLIKDKFNVSIAIRTVGDYLNRWGYTPQKPKRKAYE